MMSKKTYFTSLKEHIKRIPENPVFYKDRVTLSSAPDRANILGSPTTQASGNKRAERQNTKGTISPQMSFYHGESSCRYTYLKRTKDEDPMLSPKQLVSAYFDKNKDTRTTDRNDSCIDNLLKTTDSR